MKKWLIVGLAVLAGCSGKSKIGGDRIREYANALYNRELYTQAVREYQRYLDLYPVEPRQQANINLIIGDIYFDRLHDYENAMAYYLKIKHVYPESEVESQAAKRIVECLERLQRSADAKQALDEATSLNPAESSESRPGTVLARIGERTITSGDLEYQIKQLPEALQKQLAGREARLDFLKNLVATELLYEASKRKGMDRDKDVIEGTFQTQKGLMVQAYLRGEIEGQIRIQPQDVELYYEAHKDRYVEKDDKGRVKRQLLFAEAREQAARELLEERQQRAIDDLLQRMLRTDDVKIYDDLVK